MAEEHDELLEQFKHAVKDGDLDAIQKFLDGGVDINEVYGSSGFAVIHMACADGNLKVLEFLIKQPGINLSQKDAFGNTPISVIAACDDRAKMEELLDAAMGETHEDEDIVGKYGKIASPDKTYHAFISHVFGANHSLARNLKESLAKVGVKACMNEDLVIENGKLEDMISESDTAIILITKKYMKNVEQADEMDLRGNALEFSLVLDFIEEYKIIPVVIDEQARKEKTWKGEFERLAESTVVDMSNKKLRLTNLGKLYHEIKA
eukprot:CAMPEP_0184038682 /NCGR_PEP_ID=MMETSP0955-20130417/48464_1 /TAXON_ID=627963 /ORGANISM="Aplanochytrium sp, Strain PBS07" /LENGTH=263 /DNA_ID=CAMNT_0026327441 /DNA_START=50 /DNA_END=838 /DNA_ORIENTATION=-